MRNLLDINLLISLIDSDHVFHEKAHKWWAKHSREGWASCPITENGMVRVMSNPSYSKKVVFPPSDLISRLRRFTANTNHQFWGADLSLLDSKIFNVTRIHRSKQITDLYLLSLAVCHQGRLVTFDTNIDCAAVHHCKEEHLCIL